MTSEVGGRGPELTKPLLEEIQSLDQRGKKKGREAPVKRGMTHSVCRGLLQAVAGLCQICKYTILCGLCHSSERSAETTEHQRVQRRGHRDADSAAVGSYGQMCTAAGWLLEF